MPTTRYGVRVGVNVQKRYSVLTSAAPILSNQKRYGIQVENRVILTKQYPMTLRSYSLRYAHSEQETRARRKEREISASLLAGTIALDDEVNELEIALNESFTAKTDRMHTDVLRDVLETTRPQTIATDALMHPMAQGSNRQWDWTQMSETDTGIVLHDRLMEIVEQEQGAYASETLEVVGSALEATDVLQVQDAEPTSLISGVPTSNDHEVAFVRQETVIRSNMIKHVEESATNHAKYTSELFSTYLLLPEMAQVDRPVQRATLSEMDMADSPYMETFEHRIYSASYISEIHDTSELKPWSMNRRQLDIGLMDKMISAKEYGRTEDVGYEALESSIPLERLYHGTQTALTVTEPLLTTRETDLSGIDEATFEQVAPDTVLLEQQQALLEQSAIDASANITEQANRFTRIMRAFEQKTDRVFNDGQVIPSIQSNPDVSTIKPSLREIHRTDPIVAVKGVGNVRPAVESILDNVERYGREWGLHLSKLDRANGNVVIHNGSLDTFERSEYLATEWTRMILDALERSNGNRAIISALSDQVKGVERRSEDVLPVEEVSLIRGRGFGHSFNALLETMDAGDKDGRPVEETRIEAVDRIRVDHLSEMTDTFRGALIGNVELVTQDQQEKSMRSNVVKSSAFDDQEHVTITSRIKDGAFSNNERVPRVSRERFMQLTEAVQVNVQPTLDEVTLSTIETSIYADYEVEATESYMSKAHTSDSWLSSALSESGQARALATQGEAILAVSMQTERQAETEWAEMVAFDATTRETNRNVHLERADSAGKMTNYTTYLSLHATAHVNVIPEDTWMSTLLPAIHETSVLGIGVTETFLHTASAKQEEYEVDEIRLDGALGAARDVDEQRIDATVRKQAERNGMLTDSERGGTLFRDTEALLSVNVTTSRADAEMDTHRNDLLQFERIDSDQIAYVDSFESGLRWSEQIANNVDAFMHAERLHVEPTYRSDQLDQAERMSENVAIHFLMPFAKRLAENDASLSNVTEHAERMDQVITTVETVDAAERMDETMAMLNPIDTAEHLSETTTSLEPIDSAERVTVNETFLTQFDALERRYSDEAMFEDWYKAQRITKPARLEVGTTAERIAVDYTELADYILGAKTMKSGVLIDAETAEHQAIEDVDLAEYGASELIIKKKKKIWLIPAHGNHWNNWSGWKKTR